MTQLIDKSSPEYFQQTSDEPYERHDYKLIYSNNNSKVFDNYMDLQAEWFQTPHQFRGYVEVLDKRKIKTSQGFK